MAARFLLTVNPFSGGKRGRRVLAAVRPIFAEAGAELTVLETTRPGHARDLIRTADLTGVTGFCAVGGDGTMHELVNGLLTRPDGARVPLGLIPGGTGNAFLRSLGLGTPAAAARAVVGGWSRSIDAAVVQGGTARCYACNVVGWGFPTDVAAKAEGFRWLGRRRYDLLALWEIARGRRRPAPRLADDRDLTDAFTFIMACNTPYTGDGMRLAPAARLDDGKIDLVLVRRATRRQLLGLLPRVYAGTHVDHPLVEQYAVREFSLVPEVDGPLNVDGEILGGTPVTVRVRPAAFDVFAPDPEDRAAGD